MTPDEQAIAIAASECRTLSELLARVLPARGPRGCAANIERALLSGLAQRAWFRLHPHRPRPDETRATKRE